jgi:hypothetical protein
VKTTGIQKKEDVAPEFARVAVVEHQFAIGRWALRELIKKGVIKSVVVKPSKRGKGFRVIDLDSVRRYLEQQSATGGDV